VTSLVTKEEYKERLLMFISYCKSVSLDNLKDMLEDASNVKGDYESNPSKPTLNNIKSTGETAFQRAIFNNKEVVIDYNGLKENDRIKWLDIELPVVLNKNPRRPCIDLIGALDGIPVICELKYAENSNSDHPIYGVVELLIYYYFIHCNYEKLDKYSVHHSLVLKDFKWSTIINNGFPKIMLTANTKYWNYWFGRENKAEFLKTVLNLAKMLDVNLACYEANDENFNEQKGDMEHYTPILTSNIWKRIV